MTEPFKPDWDAMAVMVEEQQRMAKRIEELEQALAQPAHEPVMWNGLTESETNATASVAGLTKHVQPAWAYRDVMLSMMREAEFNRNEIAYLGDKLVRFATLVEDAATAAANARANTSWALMCEKMVAAEREKCAKVCDMQAASTYWEGAYACAAAIRARSEK